MELQLEQVAHAHGARQLFRIEALTLPAASRLALRGGSGSGKTTLLHILAGILRPQEGRVVYGDTVLSALAEAQRDRFRAAHIGYIFQTFNLLQGLTALENVAFAATLGGRRVGQAQSDAQQLLERVGLQQVLKQRPATLSVGEQQRVAVARALVNRPSVVLCDEPTSSLDQRSTSEVLELIDELTTEVGSTLICASHDEAVLRRFSDSETLTLEQP